MSEAGFRFRAGDPVRVRPGPPEAHCRTPFYLRGRPGVILKTVGIYRNPSQLAFHKPGLPTRPLYRVRFRHQDVWPARDVTASDSIVADLYEHWLEAEPPATRD